MVNSYIVSRHEKMSTRQLCELATRYINELTIKLEGLHSDQYLRTVKCYLSSPSPSIDANQRVGIKNIARRMDFSAFLAAVEQETHYKTTEVKTI